MGILKCVNAIQLEECDEYLKMAQESATSTSTNKVQKSKNNTWRIFSTKHHFQNKILWPQFSLMMMMNPLYNLNLMLKISN